MGHSSITITYDRYGDLMPGNEDEAAALLDTYLEREGQLRASEGQQRADLSGLVRTTTVRPERPFRKRS
jgi:hypothetical protein